MAFLGTQSNSWGPAYHLHVYKQFLALIFKYGALLVAAWAEANPGAFQVTTSSWKELISWISNIADNCWKVTANLCGLSLLATQFQHLSIAYQQVLEQMDLGSPLPQILHQAGLSSSQ